MLSDIRDRKLVHWIAAYAAAAFVALQGLQIVAEGFGWSELPLRIALILALVGAPVVVVLGWYHGEKGSQGVTRTEAFLLSGLAMMGVVALLAFGRPASRIGEREGGLPDAQPRLDPARYAILPFRREGNVPDGLSEDLLMHDAVARWGGIQLVDLLQVRDVARRLPTPLDVSAAADIASEFGAGRFIRGTLSDIGDGLRVYAALHDTRSHDVLADTTIFLREGSRLEDSTAARVAVHLLFRGAGTGPAVEESDLATTSFSARSAFVDGWKALEHWDLEAADSAFERALVEDPGYSRAHLWRAQVRNWKSADARELLASAEIAAAAASRLTERERLLARGLVALAREDYGAACAAYEALREADDLDFAAWYGLGECRHRDVGVVSDPSSPTGWAFRSSKHASMEAFRRAFEVLPLAHRGFRSGTFERVKDLLFVGPEQIRQGRAVPPDTGVFWARPALLGDTLAFIPLRLADFSAGAHPSRPATHWQAVERQREVFARLATGWVAAFPTSVPALQALALARELTGEPEALDLLRRARLLADGARPAHDIMAEEIRLLIKLGGPEDFVRAAAVADTLLSAPPGAVDDRQLAEIAALVGRAGRAAAHARKAARSAELSVTIPADVMRSAEALLAFAALGGPSDSLLAAERLVVGGLENRFPSRIQEAVAHQLMDLPASLAFISFPLGAMERL
ncbi:MAG TPA: hypothetical protein VMM12_09360, partial [Longimicrobiales bacterium]|nr:hypothetical protein [Longimicrobiales bacterium]